MAAYEHPAPGVPTPPAPAGWWPSPWKPARVAAGKVSRAGLQADGPAVFWSESRPGDGGRQVVVRALDGSAPEDVSPDGVSVRSRVHEYGGGAATVEGGTLYYVDQADQRWYRFTPGAEGSPPVALTPAAGPDGPSVRYADGRLTRSGRWLISVEERVEGHHTGHRLVACPARPDETAPAGAGAPTVLEDRGDFFASPRVSPDGGWLAWVSWDHPSMPWDSSTLWAGRLVETASSLIMVEAHPVAGGQGVSVGQVHWGRDGSLTFVDDRSGWWLPYRVPAVELTARSMGRAATTALVDAEADFHAPDWVFGQVTMAELSDGSVVTRRHGSGRDELVLLTPPGLDSEVHWGQRVIDQPCVSITGVVVADGDEGGRVCVLGSTATEAYGVFEVAVGAPAPARRLSGVPGGLLAADRVSHARAFVADTPEGPVPGLLFLPVDAVGEETESPDSSPPLVVICHGGPTSAAEPGFDPTVQFFASHGLAVAVVDYRGSSGYGTAYRRRLDGLWGEADVDDCVNYARALADAGLVDGGRMAIRGSSAGGLTALAALIRARSFQGAVAWYGVTDLAALATDTHDFESRYVDSLVGEWPGAAETYRARSPIHHVDELEGRVLLLQGADDPVVPPDQSERFAAELAAHGVACELIVFAGESHGFRRATTIEAALSAELDFYRGLFAAGHTGGPEVTGPGAG
jgi:dipeptidyl aminopeptidase/acylaminoacyl peptidase